MAKEELPPTGRMYRALRNQKRPFGQALSEWIDNSFGENRGNADCVWVVVLRRRGARHIAIIDDGKAPVKLGDVVQIGAGAISGGYDTGRFGWGGSVAQLAYASKSWMWALREDGLVAHGEVDWDNCVENEVHPAVDSEWKTSSAGGAFALKTLRQLGHGFWLEMRVLPNKHISSDAIKETLAREFSAGLRAGKKIYWREDDQEVIAIEPWMPPDLSDVVSTAFDVGPGLTVELEAGWSAILSPVHQGLELEYGPRRLARITSPFEGYHGETIFGWLRLVGEGWLDHLESEKTGISTDSLRQLVEDKAKELLTPLMEELKSIKRDEALIEIAGDLASMLNALRKKQGFPDTTGWIVRGGTREKRDGESKDQHRGRKITIEGKSTLGPMPFVVECPRKGDWTITLNDGVPLIKRALEERPPDRPILHMVLAEAIAFELAKDPGAAVELGLFSEDKYESLEGEFGDMQPVVLQRLLELVTV